MQGARWALTASLRPRRGDNLAPRARLGGPRGRLPLDSALLPLRGFRLGKCEPRGRPSGGKRIRVRHLELPCCTTSLWPTGTRAACARQRRARRRPRGSSPPSCRGAPRPACSRRGGTPGRRPCAPWGGRSSPSSSKSPTRQARPRPPPSPSRGGPVVQDHLGSVVIFSLELSNLQGWGKNFV